MPRMYKVSLIAGYVSARARYVQSERPGLTVVDISYFDSCSYANCTNDSEFCILYIVIFVTSLMKVF